MSTRSFIGMLNDDGTVTGHYCHSDGYYSWNGRILNEHYRDAAKVKRLIDLGGMSVLGPDIGKKHDFDWRFALQKSRDFEKEWKALPAEEQQKYLGTDGKPNRYVYENEEIDKLPESKMCRFYTRDRGEDWKYNKPKTTPLDECDFQSYQYLYDPDLGVWFCSGGHDDEWRVLSEVIAEIDAGADEYNQLSSRVIDMEKRIAQFGEVGDLARELVGEPEAAWA